MNNKDKQDSIVFIHCEYVSLWDGFGEVSSPAKYDPFNNKVYDVEMSNLSDEELAECEILIGEYMDLLGTRFELGERSDDDTWDVEGPHPLHVITKLSDLKQKPSFSEQIQSAEIRATELPPTPNRKVKESEPEI